MGEIERMRSLMDALKVEVDDAWKAKERLTNEKDAVHCKQQLAVTRYNALNSAYSSLLSAVLHLEKMAATGQEGLQGEGNDAR